jgi:hypothetical protein
MRHLRTVASDPPKRDQRRVTSKKAKIRGLTGEGWRGEKVDVFPHLPPAIYHLLTTFIFNNIPAFED